MASAEPPSIEELRERAAELKDDHTPDGLRERLSILGEIRQALDAEDAELTQDVTEALGHAYNVIPVTECAERLKMHRTTVYRVYHPHGT